MRHRNLLIGSIIAIPIGLYMWDMIGPMIANAAGAYFSEGLWMRNLGVTEYTKPFWTGLIVSLIGFIISLAGVAGIIIVLFLNSRKGNRQVPQPPRAP